MNILRLAFELFVIYMVYKLVFEFIIPVYRTTRHMKQKMTDMHQKMQEQQEANHPKHNNISSAKEPSRTGFSDDYIDYEEVK
ncbi:MAG: hypothetical protein ABIT58_08015 [Ferruginibacter sp.]